ncbi:MAG: permease [Spirochaetes bacterium]|nr:permease [Spirochaetota bacterium]
METYISELIRGIIYEIVTSLSHNWLPLSVAVLISGIMNVYINQEKLKKALLNRPKISIWASVLVGAFTPLCACGTMGVVIGMLTTALPWGPVMAFLTSSPLMSPDGFVLLSGIISVKFAIALTIASVMIGLMSGYITHLIESKTDFLKNQSRFSEKSAQTKCGCGDVPAAGSCGCGSPASAKMSYSCCGVQFEDKAEREFCCTDIILIPKYVFGFLAEVSAKLRLKELFQSIFNIGIKQILLFFCIFIAVGFLINHFVPMRYITGLLGSGNPLAVPLSALVGLPLYVAGESAVPLIKSLMDSGASGGAMIAFLITGPATSAWVIAGIAVFMKKKIILLYIGFILAGGILSGYIYNLVDLIMK